MEKVIVWAAISPTPQSTPELIIWVFTGWIAKQFWYHLHNLNIFPDVEQQELMVEEKWEEWEIGDEFRF